MVEPPTFSLGLTASDEEKGNASSSGAEANVQHKGKEKKDEKKVSDKVGKDNDADPRLRHKLSIPKVYDIMQMIEGKTRKDEIVKELTECGFGGMRYICNWTKIPTSFVDWIVKSFEKEHMWIRLTKTKVLPLRDDDVHRVYELPMAGKEINLDLCSDGAIRRLRRELGLGGGSSPRVKVSDLESKLKTIEHPKAWVKGAICYIIHNILCPTNHSGVSLQYAQILEDPAGVSSYNWCSYVLQYMKEGLQNPIVANPLADFHFLMINYMEKMGKKSPFLTGRYKRPSLRDWDVKTATQDIQKVHDVMGLEYGLTAGVTTLNNTDEVPLVLCFDADTCPLSAAPMHLNHCRSCIMIYNRAAEILERRLAEGKDGAAEQKVGNEQANIDEENVRKQGLRYKSSANRRKVIPNVGDEEADDGQGKQPPLSGTQETILQYPQYFDAGMEKKGEKNDEKNNEKDDKKDEKTDEKKHEKKVEKNDEKKDGKDDKKDEKTDEKKHEKKDVGCGADEGNVGKKSLRYKASVKKRNNTADDEEADDGQGPQPPLSVTQETILHYPQYFDPSSEYCENVVVEATPLRTVLVDEIIDLSQADTVKPTRMKRKHEKEDRTYPERRRAVKKSKYLTSPYDTAVYESTATKLQKDICTYAWSSSIDEEEILYCSKSHDFTLQRKELWTLNKDEWISCFVVNSWVNYLNWRQRKGQMTRLVTQYINYQYMERPDALEMEQPAAFNNFIARLKWFKYMDWKKIDPTSLEYIMTPVLIGNPGSHYVCFVVNLKSHRFQFLNSMYGDKLDLDPPNIYKKMFDVWLKEVNAFLIGLYTHKKMPLPFHFSKFSWESPRMPTQIDKDNCGVFCMKFLEEWQGDHYTQMESFKNWSQLGKRDKIARVMDLRIGILSTILTDSSNSIRHKVEKNATSYCEELTQKLG
ncbi:unnamed protein product [Trifolium pratense]|uniref:Uncharacterized protein n=1 Tax=Trifolium pratense TaxID=57577 RepID=A0ACB0LVA3_TRIPR|nr:unnamed protein product [Trifolium pratense]